MNNLPDRIAIPLITICIVLTCYCAWNGQYAGYLAGLSGLAVCLVGITAEKRAKEKGECRHELRLIAVQPVEHAVPACTIALKKCQKCGDHQSFILGGTWGLEDLVRDHSEIEELKRVWGKP